MFIMKISILRFFLILILSVLLLNSCYMDNLDKLTKIDSKMEVESGFGVPVAFGSVRLSDAVNKSSKDITKGYLEYVKDMNEDSTIRFVYDAYRDSITAQYILDTSRQNSKKNGRLKMTKWGPKSQIVGNLSNISIKSAVALQNNTNVVTDMAILRIHYIKISSGILTVDNIVGGTATNYLVYTQNKRATQDTLIGKITGINSTLNIKNARFQKYIKFVPELGLAASSILYRIENIVSSGAKITTADTLGAPNPYKNVEKVFYNENSLSKKDTIIVQITPFEDKRIDTVLVTNTFLNFHTVSTIPGKNVTLKMLPLKNLVHLNGSVPGNMFTDSIVVPRGDQTKGIFLNNVIASTDSTDPKNPNKFPLVLQYSIHAPQKDIFEFDSSWSVTLDIPAIDSIGFRQVKGFLGKKPYRFTPNSYLNVGLGTKMGDLASAIGGKITFTNPKLYIAYKSSVGFNADLNLQLVGISKSGEKITVMDSSVSFPIKSPKYPKLSDNIETIVDSIKIDNSNSKYIGSFFNILPDNLMYTGIVRPNKHPQMANGKILDNFINNDSRIDMNIGIVVPMQFSMNDFAISNTSSFTFPEVVEGINTIKLNMKYRNYFPLSARMKLEFLSVDGAVVYTLDETILNPATPTDVTIGKVDKYASIKPQVFSKSLSFINNKKDIENIKSAKKVKVTAILNTFERRSVTIYAHYGIDFNFGVEIDGKIVVDPLKQ